MTETTIDSLGEVALVGRIVELLGVEAPAASVAVGPGDDAAVVEAGSRRLALTTDGLIESVHFRSEWIGPGALGGRAVAINVSDLGAMGAAPEWLLVALSLPADVEIDWVEALAGGLRAAAADYGCAIVGGDVARVPDHVGIHVTAVGTFPEGVAPVRRDTARDGDGCWITGHPGRAGAGRALLEAGFRADRLPDETAEAAARCIDAYLAPDPPVAFGCALAAAGLASAMIDVSDGVSTDLLRVCRRSDVGVVVDAAALCSDPDLEAVAESGIGEAEDWMLGGGEDYGLLCAVAPRHEAGFVETAAAGGVEIRQIGRFTRSEDGCCIDRGGWRDALTPLGWDHFSGGREGR